MITRLAPIAVLFACALLLAACGSTVEQRAASGGLGGAAIGALAGGPAGAAIGGAAGAGVGAALPEGADILAMNLLHGESRTVAGTSRDRIKQVQRNLQAQGLYHGPIDGIRGPKTKQALAAYQRNHGLRPTAQPDTSGSGSSMSATGDLMTNPDQFEPNGSRTFWK